MHASAPVGTEKRASPNYRGLSKDAFILSARFASYCARPLDFLHPDHLDEVKGDLSREDFEKLKAAPAFNIALNKMAARKLKLISPAISRDSLSKLSTNAAASALSQLLFSPFDRIELFVRYITGARLQKAILACVLKSERQKIEAALGAEAFNSAIREAPLLYAGLARSLERQTLSGLMSGEGGLLRDGFLTLQAFARQTDEGLADLLKWRLPNSAKNAAPDLSVAEYEAFSRMLMTKGLTQ